MTEPRSGRTVLLDARAAVRCPVALDHTISGTEQDAASDVVLKWRDAASAHRRIVLDRVRAGTTPFVEITDLDSAAARAATRAAIADGAPIILSPRLADDLDGGRRGRADLLIQCDGGYLPVLIKRHRIAEVATNGRARSSSLERPTLGAAVIVHGRRLGKAARDDAMELAHLRRLMDATEVSGPPRGGLVDAEGVLWWVELDATRGGGAGSLLERYDREFALRQRVVARAELRRSDPAVPPVVVPLHKAECARCGFEQQCHGEMEASDSVSLVPGMQWRHALKHRAAGRGTRQSFALLDPVTAAVGHAFMSDDVAMSLSDLIVTARGVDPETPVPHLVGEHMEVRRALRRSGIDTAGALGALDEDTGAYGALGAGDVATLIDRARAGWSGHPYLRRGLTEAFVTRATVEVDLDMERGDHGVYLWGMVVTLRGEVAALQELEGTYLPFCSFDPLDGALEADLLRQLVDELQRIDRAVAEVGGTLAIYFYSHAEIDEVRRIATASGDEDLIAFAKDFASSDRSVDLRVVAESNLVLGHGFRLKKLATYAGFSWRDEDPSGSASMTWYDRAVGDPDRDIRAANAARILAYNEDDCRATLALRNWLESAPLRSIADWTPPDPARGSSPA